jgi:hypothetical protein
LNRIVAYLLDYPDYLRDSPAGDEPEEDSPEEGVSDEDRPGQEVEPEPDK